MELLKGWDWGLVAFVGTSLLNEWLSHPRPTVHYWNGERELRRKSEKK
ncbi:hypothetical protein [Paenibacillus thermotolerans]|nr:MULTISPECIES: hypothetical protein [unclassified Paenibacillus]